MKKTLVVLALLILGSCNSNETMTFGLMGEWKWSYVCGGITGECGYADVNSTRALEVTEDGMIETWNDGSVTTKTYSISSRTKFEDYTEDTVQFDNGSTTEKIKATRNTLEINGGEVWIGYKRNGFPL